ncbi:MAG: sulfatase-like hydrolase/transferase, partial [Rikenellaceae bacterium]
MKPTYLMPAVAAASSLLGSCATPTEQRPNLLIIQTDEQSFRTLSCYRELLDSEQANIWGNGANVETPHIDRLASEGALCNNYYASSPVSTPSRASFQTGLYPVATGAPINGMTMTEGLVSFAEVLQKDGYQTDYV